VGSAGAEAESAAAEAETAGAEAESGAAVDGAGETGEPDVEPEVEPDGEPDVEPEVEPDGEPEGSVLPHAWQLVCPRKTSFAPQNWQVGLAAPCPSINLNLTFGSAETRTLAARQYDLANRPKDRPDGASRLV
jgi:hypothetical protein